MTYLETAAHGHGASGTDDLRGRTEPLEVRQWTIKNLDATVVDKARAAAKRKGMKINSWIAATIESAAETGEANDPSRQSALAADLAELLDKIEESRKEDRLRIERIEKDISQLVKSQSDMISNLLSRCFDDRN